MKVKFNAILSSLFIALLVVSIQLDAGGYESCEEYAARRQSYLNRAEAGDSKAAFSFFLENMNPCSTCLDSPLGDDHLDDPPLGKWNYVESWKWLLRAADLGHPDAQ